MASQLFHANVEDIDCPTYEALSYCWGNPREGKKYTEMNGAPFAATGKLHAALVQLTDVSNGRPLRCYRLTRYVSTSRVTQ